MIGVGLLFIFVAGVAFLGFIIGAFFNRIKVTKILPLMLIGLIAGPVLHLVNTGPGSTIANLVPVVSALAISFILFDVGLNINIFRLGKILARATAFTFALAIVTGIIISIAAYFVFGWTLFESFIFGFALCGPSSVIVPTLLRSLKVGNELNDTLLYEGVATDALQLVVPILLLQLMFTSNVTVAGAFGTFVISVFGAVVLGAVLAAAWLYLLKNFEEYSKGYGWMLTITMVLATYGVAYELGLSTVIAVFTFGIAFANLGMITLSVGRQSDESVTPMRSMAAIFIMQRLHLGNSIRYIKDYQKEVEFFTSTFFFVYIGLLFTIGGLTPLMIGIATVIVLLMILLRYLFLPALKGYMSGDLQERRLTMKLISFDVSRGLSPAIVATLPLALYNITIPGFLNEIFLVVLFSNVASTIGILKFFRREPRAPAEAQVRKNARRRAQPAEAAASRPYKALPRPRIGTTGPGLQTFSDA